jgi:CelD/BcsL family acetyltransferase involved in cellulose biosynthesis
MNQETFASEYLGYDADLGKYSPGMYLIMKVIEDFCEDNEHSVAEVDFAPGHAQYKEVLGNREWQEGTVYIFSRTLKGLELNFVRCFTSGTHHILKSALGQTRFLQKIRKFWRDHSRRQQTEP